MSFEHAECFHVHESSPDFHQAERVAAGAEAGECDQGRGALRCAVLLVDVADALCVEKHLDGSAVRALRGEKLDGGAGEIDLDEILVTIGGAE